MSDAFSMALIAILLVTTLGLVLVCTWLQPEPQRGVDGAREPGQMERTR